MPTTFHHDAPENHPAVKGAFAASTSAERIVRLQEWLTTQPSLEHMADVYKDMAARDKGAAKLIKEQLEEHKRLKNQQAVSEHWAQKAQHLLALPKFNLADGLAWPRDAAKAGAALSKEPLSSLKAQLADRVRAVEDLQNGTQVQREAAVLIAQRIETLSVKPWTEAQAALEPLEADVLHWRAQAEQLTNDAHWSSVDLKFPPLLEASGSQLQAVWEAFAAAVAVAVKAAADPTAPLPAVPLWAEALRVQRGLLASDGTHPDHAPTSKLEAQAKQQQAREHACALVQAAIRPLEEAFAQGHSKIVAKAALDLRNLLKTHVRYLDPALEAAAHAALTAAGELQDWQRWRADQIREELLAKAEKLRDHPLGGRKQQEALRHLREHWKLSDQGGTPNQALWRRFDDACNQAHLVVEAWIESVKEQIEAHKTVRLALVAEVLAWAETHKDNTDWKHHVRSLNHFVEQWHQAGPLHEKALAQVHLDWKAALAVADGPLVAARQASLARRQALIADATALSALVPLPTDAIKSLQQRWQHEAQSVPLERHQEQKLWDAFRHPIDAAFQRKQREREQAQATLSQHETAVVQAAQALDAACASGDADSIHAAAQALQAVLRGQAPAQPAPSAATPVPQTAVAATHAQEKPAQELDLKAQVATKNEADGAVQDHQAEQTAAQVAVVVPPTEAPSAPDTPEVSETPATEETQEATASSPHPQPAAKPAAKPVVAVRGDDRPGMKKAEPPKPTGRGGKFSDRPHAADARTSRSVGAPHDRRGAHSHASEKAHEPALPRLSDAAFRAQRAAFDHANVALKKISLQAHDAVLARLLAAWEQRDATQVPSLQQLGKQATQAAHQAWLDALKKPAIDNPAGQAALQNLLLRLEIAAQVQVAPEHQAALRMLQLQLLTQRKAPAPLETWRQDVAQVLAGPFDAALARRLHNVLGVLLF